MAITEIKTYGLHVAAGDQSSVRAQIHLYDGKENTIGVLFFLEAGPLSAGDPSGVPTAHYPAARFSDIVDMLRNERPVYLVRDAAGRVTLSTKPEKVGEGEGGATGGFFAFGVGAKP